MDRKQSGFTLIEALVVMVLMVAAIITIAPMIQWMRLQGAGHAVDALQADLQLARCMAISRRKICAVQFNRPSLNHYINVLNRRHRDLGDYRGGVHFMPRGPDGLKMAEEITFNGRGMSTSIAPADIFIAGDNELHPYRLRVLLPGGISVWRWDGNTWR
jgi:hypothetical protein